MAKFTDKIMGLLSHDIGIDLGTANTLVYVKGQGIVINEPSVVAINRKTNNIVAIGKSAKEMLGRTPGHVKAVQPLVDGVVSDFEVTEEMLAYLLKKAQNKFKLLGPRVVIGVPSGITGVETRAVRDAAANAGARVIHIVEEPMAAAIGINLPVHEASGSMIIDIGGGTTDIGIISLGSLVSARNIKIAGDKLNNDVISHVRNEHKMLIGERTAEDAKIIAGSIVGSEKPLEAVIRGRDLITGLPREMVLTDQDIRNAIHHSIVQLVETIREVFENSPPELVSDIIQKGIYITGGGALIHGLPQILEEVLGEEISVIIPNDPLTAVVRGTGIILDDIDKFDTSLKEHEKEISPTT